MQKHSLYILITQTPLKTGIFIRRMTEYEYNHVSISLDDNLYKLYSFARRYRNSSFYAGLVVESSLRYIEKPTKVKIYRIPISRKTYLSIKKYLKKLTNKKNEYIYNYISAITYIFHKKVKIKNAYTCEEFSIHILDKFCKIPNLNKQNYISIKKFSEILNDYLIYEGIFTTTNKSWEEDKYLEKQNIFYSLYKVLEIYTTLIIRFFTGLIIK